MSPSSETVLGDKPFPRFGAYTILEELGRGTTGIVFKARDNRLNRVVALKIPVLGPRGEQNKQLTQFAREAKALATLTGGADPNLTKLHGVGEFQGQLFQVIEFVDGSSLEEAVANRSLDLRKGVEIAEIVARVICSRVHARGLVHRNLNPSNILLSVDGTVKLIGFGLVRLTDSATASGAPGTSPRADVNSLGRLLKELSARLGQPMPPSLEAICGKSLAEDPAQGYASAEKMADELRGFLAKQGWV
jgi:serine/threonine-protein kinase